MTQEKALEILLDMTPTVSTGWKPENLDELCKLESDNRGEKMIEETEMKREKMIEVGTKIRFNYGAMHCDEFGRVSAVSDSGIVTINGYIGFVEEINESCIMMPGETTINGSPIGVFVDE